MGALFFCCVGGLCSLFLRREGGGATDPWWFCGGDDIFLLTGVGLFCRRDILKKEGVFTLLKDRHRLVAHVSSITFSPVGLLSRSAGE